MRNSPNVWIESENAQYPLPELRDAYMLYLASRSRPIAAGTRERYEFDLKSFEVSLAFHSEPLVLDSLSPFNVERWLLDMREGRIGHRSGSKKALTPVTISTRLASLKTFSHKYIYRHLELTSRDLLAKVERYEAPERTKEGLTHSQLEQVLGCYADSDEYTHIRDRAMLAVYAASGLRFIEVLNIELSQLDPYGGWIRTIGKGNRERIVPIGDRALKAVRAYRRVRRAQDGVMTLFTTDAGGRLTYSGGQSIFRRLRRPRACRGCTRIASVIPGHKRR